MCELVWRAKGVSRRTKDLVVRYNSYLFDSVKKLSGSSTGFYKRRSVILPSNEGIKYIYNMHDSLDPAYHSMRPVIEHGHRTAEDEWIPGCTGLFINTIKPLVR
jgi:hypothetical protein